MELAGLEPATSWVRFMRSLADQRSQLSIGISHERLELAVAHDQQLAPGLEAEGLVEGPALLRIGDPSTERISSLWVRAGVAR
jgi:hypothetical protein